VVFDTGLLACAALRASSAAHRALWFALRSGLVCVSEQSVERLQALLRKGRLDRYMRKRARVAFISVLLRNAWVCPVSPVDLAKLRPSLRNRGNRLILALAAVAEADLIVSNDADLLARKAWRDIPILTPAEFLDQFDQG